MADTKISALTDGTTANGTDRIAVARDPTGTPLSRYITPSYIRTYILGLAATWSANSAVSAPAFTATGTWFTGGTETTTKPHWLLEPSGATSTAWSTAGTGLGINAASGFTGNLIDAQLDGAARFSVTSAGLANVLQFTAIQGQFGGTTSSGGGIWVASSSSMAFGGNFAGPFLRHDGTTAQLAQRDGTTAQTFRIYNTYTDASNYERLGVGYTSNVLFLDSQAAGTGTVRILEIRRGGTPHVQLSSGRTFFGVESSMAASTQFTFSDGANFGRGFVGVTGAAAIKVTNGSTGGGALQFQEMTAPSAPATNLCYLYAEDNGGGKTRLMVRFPTGAAQQVAIEP